MIHLLSEMEAKSKTIKPAQFDEILKSISEIKSPKRKGKKQGYLYENYEKLVGLAEDIKLNKIFSELETNTVSMKINDLKVFFGEKTVNQFLNTADLTIGTLRSKIIAFKKNIALGSGKAIELLEYLEKTVITVLKQLIENIPSLIKTKIESLIGKLSQEIFPKMSKTSKILSEFAGALLDLPDLLLDGFSVAFAFQDYELREVYNVQQQKEIEKTFWTSAFTFLGGVILFIGGIIAAYLACIPAIICLAVTGIFLGIYELITSNDAIGQLGYWLSSEIGFL
ncbi:hypothetical protein [Runella rosea]|nr:hypothetical protein [Runella rosea]